MEMMNKVKTIDSTGKVTEKAIICSCEIYGVDIKNLLFYICPWCKKIWYNGS